MIDHVEDKSELFLVSGDGDWTSPLDDEQFDSFLLDEWTQKKRSELFFYRRLSAFLKDHFPAINLLTEEEKDQLIQDLANSGSFRKSRAILQQLAGHIDFTASQLNAIAKAATSNNQIYWIATDADISKNLRSLLGTHTEELEPVLLANLEKIMERPLAD